MRRAVGGLVAGLAAVCLMGPAAAADDFQVVDDTLAYRPDETSYDPDTDVVITQGVDVDTGNFWIAMQCAGDATWRMNAYTGEWKAREALPDYLKTFHDVVCSVRGSVPYLAFRMDDIPPPR